MKVMVSGSEVRGERLSKWLLPQRIDGRELLLPVVVLYHVQNPAGRPRRQHIFQRNLLAAEIAKTSRAKLPHTWDRRVGYRREGPDNAFRYLQVARGQTERESERGGERTK